jgi:hypothetical protein
MQGEFFISAAQGSDKVILECTDGPFCCVATMDALRDELKVDMLVSHVLLEPFGAFIVEALELGL